MASSAVDSPAIAGDLFEDGSLVVEKVAFGRRDASLAAEHVDCDLPNASLEAEHGGFDLPTAGREAILRPEETDVEGTTEYGGTVW